tara:strand:+ start:1379 stop:1906 length:528 start_codon:yes stop_codon:yes gene_type:complete
MSFFSIFKSWKDGEEGMAAVEAAMVFPIMVVMLLGVFDLGNAILTNQKALRASQVVADLIARNGVVSDQDIDDAIEAGRLAFEPLDSSSYGVDIISIRFDEDENSEIVWRETMNMSGVANPLGDVDALKDVDEGVVMVAVHYDFEPKFAKFLNDISMNEVAFSRGRRSPVVVRDN